VKKFVGSYKPEHSLLDVENPATFGPFDMYDYYMEHKMQEHEAMKKALKIVKDVGKEYEKISGRKYDILSEHRLDDADIALVALGSTAGTARDAIDNMRKKGIYAGLLKLRLFRPFPAEDIKNALKDMKAVAVLDRSDSFGAFGGPVFSELRSAMYKTRNMEIVNYIYGLGGRDITSEHIKKVISDMDGISKTGEVKEYVQYLGVR